MSRIPLHGLQRGKDTELDLEKLRLLDDGVFIQGGWVGKASGVAP